MTRDAFRPEVVAQFENDTWSRCARTYAEGFGALVGAAVDPLLEAAEVKKGDRVLDVGTGPGLVAVRAAARGAEVVGIDFSEAMIEEARLRHPELELRTASAESLPFEDETFDRVVGNFVLHHLGEPDRALGESFRVLAPGGRMALTVWADLSKLEAFGVFFAAVEQHLGSADLPHGPLFGVSDFDAFHGMVREAGFGDSTVRELPIAWRTSSLDPYLAAFADWANLGALPEAKRRAIEASVREAAEPYRSGDDFVLPNPAILITGVK